MSTPVTEPRINVGTFLPLITELTLDLADGRLSDDEIERLGERLGDAVKVLGQVVAARRRAATAAAAAAAQAAAAVPPAPVAAPTPPAPVAPPVAGVTLTALKASILFGERDRKGGNSGPQYDAVNETQGKGDRVHFDCTPTPDVPAFNETLVQANGVTPLIEPRWGRVGPDGVEILDWNSHDEPDHFGLESWEKRPGDTSGPGLTPVLLLNNQFGPGRTRCFLYFVLAARDNDGVGLESNRVYWMAD